LFVVENDFVDLIDFNDLVVWELVEIERCGVVVVACVVLDLGLVVVEVNDVFVVEDFGLLLCLDCIVD
jgi:hypothetical protein